MRKGANTRRYSRGGTDPLMWIVLAVAGALVAYKVLIQIEVGPGWDTYAFLSNAAEFAGRSVGYVEMHRPPVLAFLTSLLFRAGWMETAVIQWVDGALSLLGVAAFYALLHRRFPRVPSAFGALALLIVPSLWAYLGTGYTDFPSVSLSIWGLVFLVKATEEHPAWYTAAIPLLVVAVLTRFGALVVGVPALAWLVLRARPFRQAKYIGLGLLAALAVFLPAAFTFNRWLGDPLSPLLSAFQTATVTLGSTAEAASGGVEGGYLRGLPELLAGHRGIWAAVILLAPAALGFVSRLFDGDALRRVPKRSLAIVGLLAGGAALGQLFGGAALRQVTVFLAVVLTFRLLGPRDDTSGHDVRITASAALDATMLLWLLAYLDAHGHMSVQVARYFIPMAPAVIYFVLRGWQAWIASSAAQSERRRPVDDARQQRLPTPLVAGAWLVLSSVIALGLLLHAGSVTQPAPDALVQGARSSAEWIAANEPDVEHVVIYSDLWPLTSWYLRTEVFPMPFFDETDAFSHDLEKNDVDYYVTVRSRRFEDYGVAMSTGPVTVLERTTRHSDTLPRVLLIGDAWDAYLESLVGYDIELVYPPGRAARADARFLDSFSVDELTQYNAVAVYGFRWRDRGDAERTITEYVMDGGSVIIDASRNLDGFDYGLADTVWFDTLIRRERAEVDAELTVDDEILAVDRQLARVDAAPFVNETGGPWYGASYAPIEDDDPRDTLAWLDGRPVVTVQHLGDGHIYWVGMNLVWHAFLTENTDEARFVDAFVEYVLGSADLVLPVATDAH